MEKELKKLMAEHGIRPNKLMGQNFLTSKDVLARIIEAADLSKDDSVLEVGPGLGALTAELAVRAKKVVAVEKDPELASVLERILRSRGIKNVTVIRGDILHLGASHVFKEKYKIVANLPYYLTSRFLKKFLAEEVHKPSEILVMIQKEVAERIVARAPHMSLLSLSVQAFGTPEIIAVVPANSFVPQPKVNSAIVKISAISDRFFATAHIDGKKFFALPRAAFRQKRKTLANSLSEILGGKVSAEQILKNCGIRPEARPQELSLEDWAHISQLAFTDTEK